MQEFKQEQIRDFIVEWQKLDEKQNDIQKCLDLIDGAGRVTLTVWRMGEDHTCFLDNRANAPIRRALQEHLTRLADDKGRLLQEVQEIKITTIEEI